MAGGLSGGSVGPQGARPASQGQPIFMEQMAEFFQHVARAAPGKSMIERMARYKPTDFNGRKDEDASTAKFWLERTERIL